jgi:threonine-phosphate decarboxylase
MAAEVRDDRVLPAHGGDRDAAAERYGVDPSTFLDLSANINPLGPPARLLAALRDAANDTLGLQRYPEPTYRALRLVLARELCVDPACIVVGNGAAALLDVALSQLRARRCLLPVPAFSEDERALHARDVDIVPVRLEPAADFLLEADSLLERARMSGADVALITNPHNPSGALVARARLSVIVDSLAAIGCRTIVDEAFVDYVPGESTAEIAARSESLICIRSVTKFFAVPALRVGYAVCSPSNAAALRAHLPSWPVTSVAADAVAAAFADRDFAERTIAGNALERAWLGAQLESLGCRVPPAAANFVFAGLPSPATSGTVTARLAREFGILVRDCASYSGLSGEWIRIAVRTRAESGLAVAAIGTVLGELRP